MTTLFSLTTAVKRPSLLRLSLSILLILLLISGVVLYTSPIGQRYWANQTAALPVHGVQRVQLLSDTQLNHVFAPAVVELPAGTTLTWEFADVDEAGQPVAHNIVFADSASPVQAVGQYQRTFDTPGTFDYVCTLHPFMAGRVQVVAADN